uniref:Pectate lyase n=1 Tax=Meloidogyne floridensis TaxID=298350 RepID=A0A915NIE4_9BILA
MVMLANTTEIHHIDGDASEKKVLKRFPYAACGGILHVIGNAEELYFKGIPGGFIKPFQYCAKTVSIDHIDGDGKDDADSSYAVETGGRLKDIREDCTLETTYL